MKIRCAFYDDGHGNGNYCSGMGCGPPTCSFSKIRDYSIDINCDGNTNRCSIQKGKLALKRTIKIYNLKKELNNI